MIHWLVLAGLALLVLGAGIGCLRELPRPARGAPALPLVDPCPHCQALTDGLVLTPHTAQAVRLPFICLGCHGLSFLDHEHGTLRLVPRAHEPWLFLEAPGLGRLVNRARQDYQSGLPGLP